MNSPRSLMSRLVFPFVNAVSCALLFGLLGVYISALLPWALRGMLIGFAVGLFIEWLTGYLSAGVYRRRVLISVLLEVPLIIFVAAPYLYVVVSMTPSGAPLCGDPCPTPLDFGATTYAQARIAAADQETIAGWYIPPRPPNDAVILLLHGAGGNRLSTTPHAEIFINAGYGVLMYDQRALGESTGRSLSAGRYDQRDLPYLIDWVSAQPGVNPNHIGAVGLSLGAHILISAAPAEPRLAALWLDGAQVQALADFPPPQNASEQFQLLMNGFLYIALDLYTGTRGDSITALLPQIAPRPLVLVAGALDTFEAQANRGYQAVVGENGEVWIIDTAWHVGGLGAIPHEYTRRMLAFFDRWLNQTSSTLARSLPVS